MNTEERNQFIAKKLGEGLSLSDVQKLLAEEHGINMTYLDLRLLVADLDVSWEKQDRQKEPVQQEKDLSKIEEEETPSKTKIEISKVVRPGATISGDVQFASGAKAEWFVDQMGRLGLNPAPGSSQPTEEDLQDFQHELQRQLTGQ